MAAGLGVDSGVATLLEADAVTLDLALGAGAGRRAVDVEPLEAELLDLGLLVLDGEWSRSSRGLVGERLAVRDWLFGRHDVGLLKALAFRVVCEFWW